MEGFNQERRGLFDGLKVPFDVNAILLSGLAVLVFLVGILGIQLIFAVPNPNPGDWFPLLSGIRGLFLGKLDYVGLKIEDILHLGHEHPAFRPAEWIAFLGWFSVVWAFFSGAMCRIAAM